MAMNRQARRMAEKQGLVDSEGAPTRPDRRKPQPREQRERTSPGTYYKEVRSELAKVAWPTWDEVVNYSLIVFVLVVTLTMAVAGLDYLFGSGIIALFDR